MRSPVLIAETPFANGHGPRFLVPPARGVDRSTAAYYVERVRDEEADVEEVEGDDYLAVRASLDDEQTGETAPQIVVLAGIDVERMTGEERDEVLEQLRERLEVLGDAVAAIDWTVHAHNLVIEIPELEEWHEAGWDVLPRTGHWAEDSVGDAPSPFRGVEERADEESKSDGPADDREDPPQSAPNTEPETREEERVEDAGEPFHRDETSPEPEPVREPVAAAPPEPEPEEPRITIELSPRSAVTFQDEAGPKREVPMPPTTAPATVAPTLTSKAADRIVVPVPQPSPAPVEPAATRPEIDPAQVLESADRSPALAPIPPALTLAARPRPLAFRWWVLGPWTASVVLVGSGYLYLTQVDKTWNQRVGETHHAAGHTKVVEVPVERVVEKVVEKPVDRVVERPVPAGDVPRGEPWATFSADWRACMSRGEVVRAADMLYSWKSHLPTLAAPPPGIEDLQTEFRTTAARRLQEWAAGRCRDHRFADAYVEIAAFSASESVKALLDGAAIPGAARTARDQVRTAEDEYHYTQIRTLAAADPVQVDQLKQHLDAYLNLLEPPGRMLNEVQQLRDYRKWQTAGRPAKAVVKIEWGPRTRAGEHTVEIELGSAKDGRPVKAFTQKADARPGRMWTEVFVVGGLADPVARIPYRVRTSRSASAVEELAEAIRERTETFVLDRPGPDPDSGTTVTVEWQGILDRPALPAWKDSKAPALPVSLPKVGP